MNIVYYSEIDPCVVVEIKKSRKKQQWSGLQE